MTQQATIVRAIPQGSQLPGLDGLRGLAALSVAGLHTMFAQPSNLSMPSAVAWAMPSLFHGVTLFFILSAFVLAHATMPLVHTDRWLLHYGLRRFFRIAPLFYAMLVFYIVIRPDLPPLWTIVCNVLFVFNFDSSIRHSIVEAGWTIGVEFPFYAMLPALLCFVKTPKHAGWMLVAAIAISIPSRFMPMTAGWSNDSAQMALASNLPTFAVGLLIWHLLRDRPVTAALRRGLMWGTLLTMAAAVVAVSPPSLPPYPSIGQMLWVVPLGLACAWQAVAPSRWLMSVPMQWLGKLSFGCYLLHLPFVYFLGVTKVYAAIQHSLGRFIGDWSFLACIGSTYIVVILASALSYHLIEVPGQLMGRWLIARTRRKAPVPA